MSRRIETEPGRDADLQLHKEVQSPAGKCIITKTAGGNAVLLVRENRLITMRYLETGSQIGLLTIGRVMDVRENIGAYFVQFLEGQVGFLPVSSVPADRLPLHQTDLIPVEVMADQQKGKKAKLTAKVNWKKVPGGQEAKEQAAYKSAFTILRPLQDPARKAIKEIMRPEEYEEIVTDLPEAYESLKDYANSVQKPIRLYDDQIFSLAKLYGLDTKVQDALQPKVWLKSGGNLVFHKTEALMVVDVNSGKYEPSKGMSREEFIISVNEEAAKEVALQLRLRNISGMILVDFLNMDSQESENHLLEAMKGFTAEDVSPVKVIDITALGIMEMTRKKLWAPLQE